jgi:transposase
MAMSCYPASASHAGRQSTPDGFVNALLTPKKYQSGETDVTGGITRVGDALVRTALYEAANAILKPTTRFSSLKRWALEVAKRRGLKRAKVALARKLATVLHRLWVDGTTFRWGKAATAA